MVVEEGSVAEEVVEEGAPEDHLVEFKLILLG